MLSAYGACAVARIAAQLAYQCKGRSMVAGDVICALGAAVEAVEAAKDKSDGMDPEFLKSEPYERFLHMQYGANRKYAPGT